MENQGRSLWKCLKLDYRTALALIAPFVIYMCFMVYSRDDKRFQELIYSAGKATKHNALLALPYPSLLHMSPPFFLTSFRNPCWLELMDGDLDPYAGNLFLSSKEKMVRILQITKVVQSNQDFWVNLKRQGIKQTERLRCLPYFYMVGVSKCGTTFLFHQLNQHPQIVRGAKKETQWWSLYSHGQRIEWPIPLHDYLDLFDGAARVINDTVDEQTNFHPLVTGDGSPNTVDDHILSWPPSLQWTNLTAAHFILHFTPYVKFIISLRNPAIRLYSNYGHVERKEGRPGTPQDFHSKVRRAITVVRGCTRNSSVRACMCDHGVFKKAPLVDLLMKGIYYEYIQDWLAVVPRHQLFITRLEDRQERGQQAYDEIFAFLAPGPNFDSEQKEHDTERQQRNENRGGDMLPETYRALVDFYRPFNQKLADLLQDSRYTWSTTEA